MDHDNRMNIILVHPYIRAMEKTFLSEPLGLVCLATHAEKVFKEKVRISILDLYAMGARSPVKNGDYYYLGVHDEAVIAEELAKLQPDLVGITCNFTAYVDDSLDVANIVKHHFPDVPIVMGGAHPTIEAAETLRQCLSVDYVVRGEGEIIFENLIRYLLGEIAIESINGLTYRKDGEIVFNLKMDLIKDIDTLPIPDRKYIDQRAYKYFNKQTVWYVRKQPVATIMTSRGCPYKCVFCSTKVVWERNWRPRSLELVFQEIEMLHREYGFREIVINDDQFMLKKSRTHAFCDYFIEKNYDLCFSVDAGISIWLVDADLMKKMRKAGFYALRFPIDSGCEKTLDYIRKPVKLDKASALIDEACRLGFWTSSNIIVGFPHETREEVNESIGYIYNSVLDFTSFIIAKPQAGSEMYEDFKKEGLLEKAVVQGSDFYRSDYDTLHFTARELNDIVNNASSKWFMHKVKFFINPINFYRYFLPKLKSIEDVRYLFSVLLAIFRRKIMPILISKIKPFFSP
uniref:Radical SAM superfamily enzyme YgiQ, UPF0313 family n=1 Tax=Candidatus Kentrum sp. UNK TaxID=2126344 RepID=A0A451AY55_9GAMM|nr:MAG: Radical SAM superfamily enzyme YgiQ, UPF0313 family [Candidatus Kentron sp. UNK]VFK70965.1 MAG: Radical SAM superfamily enzyme YgiQ, UPF0313 family [Candidatus Kentron sp. UNK]